MQDANAKPETTTNPFHKTRCRECRGTGYAEPAPCFTFGNDCPVCHGSGWLLPSQEPTHSDAAFRAGYEAGKADAIDRCFVEKLGKEWPDQRTHNIAINLCVVAIRALDVRHAVEKWKTP